jgi:hypothetical protein
VGMMKSLNFFETHDYWPRHPTVVELGMGTVETKPQAWAHWSYLDCIS